MFVHRSLQECKSSSEANWATDGESVMEDISLFRYVSRSLLQVSSHVLMQLPLRLQVLIDTEQFLNLISLVDEHGNIVTAGGWAHAPNAAHPDTPPQPSQSQTSEPLVADPTTHNITHHRQQPTRWMLMTQIPSHKSTSPSFTAETTISLGYHTVLKWQSLFLQC